MASRELLEITISCTELPKMDIFSDTDAQVFVQLLTKAEQLLDEELEPSKVHKNKLPLMRTYRVDSTECVDNNNSPIFKKKIFLPLIRTVEKDSLAVKCSIYDKDSDVKYKTIGHAMFHYDRLVQSVLSSNGELHLPIIKGGKHAINKKHRLESNIKLSIRKVNTWNFDHIDIGKIFKAVFGNANVIAQMTSIVTNKINLPIYGVSIYENGLPHLIQKNGIELEDNEYILVFIYNGINALPLSIMEHCIILTNKRFFKVNQLKNNAEFVYLDEIVSLRYQVNQVIQFDHIHISLPDHSIVSYSMLNALIGNFTHKILLRFLFDISEQIRSRGFDENTLPHIRLPIGTKELDAANMHFIMPVKAAQLGLVVQIDTHEDRSCLSLGRLCDISNIKQQWNIKDNLIEPKLCQLQRKRMDVINKTTNDDNNLKKKIIIECYENQRYFPIAGWSSKLFPTDPYFYSSENGKDPIDKNSMKPNDGYKWVDEWTLETNMTGFKLKDDGWMYSGDFSHPGMNAIWFATMGPLRFVRRRCWKRTMSLLTHEQIVNEETESKFNVPVWIKQPWEYQRIDEDLITISYMHEGKRLYLSLQDVHISCKVADNQHSNHDHKHNNISSKNKDSKNKDSKNNNHIDNNNNDNNNDDILNNDDNDICSIALASSGMRVVMDLPRHKDGFSPDSSQKWRLCSSVSIINRSLLLPLISEIKAEKCNNSWLQTLSQSAEIDYTNDFDLIGHTKIDSIEYSFYRPRISDLNFISCGDVVRLAWLGRPKRMSPLVRKSPQMKHPAGFELKWSDGMIQIFEPIPPNDNYRSLGCVVIPIGKKPKVSKSYCFPLELLRSRDESIEEDTSLCPPLRLLYRAHPTPWEDSVEQFLSLITHSTVHFVKQVADTTTNFVIRRNSQSKMEPVQLMNHDKGCCFWEMSILSTFVVTSGNQNHNHTLPRGQTHSFRSMNQKYLMHLGSHVLPNILNISDSLMKQAIMFEEKCTHSSSPFRSSRGVQRKDDAKGNEDNISLPDGFYDFLSGLRYVLDAFNETGDIIKTTSRKNTSMNENDVDNNNDDDDELIYISAEQEELEEELNKIKISQQQNQFRESMMRVLQEINILRETRVKTMMSLLKRYVYLHISRSIAACSNELLFQISKYNRKHHEESKNHQNNDNIYNILQISNTTRDNNLIQVVYALSDMWNYTKLTGLVSWKDRVAWDFPLNDISKDGQVAYNICVANPPPDFKEDTMVSIVCDKIRNLVNERVKSLLLLAYHHEDNNNDDNNDNDIQEITMSLNELENMKGALPVTSKSSNNSNMMICDLSEVLTIMKQLYNDIKMTYNEADYDEIVCIMLEEYNVQYGKIMEEMATCGWPSERKGWKQIKTDNMSIEDLFTLVDFITWYSKTYSKLWKQVTPESKECPPILMKQYSTTIPNDNIVYHRMDTQAMYLSMLASRMRERIMKFQHTIIQMELYNPRIQINSITNAYETDGPQMVVRSLIDSYHTIHISHHISGNSFLPFGDMYIDMVSHFLSNMEENFKLIMTDIESTYRDEKRITKQLLLLPEDDRKAKEGQSWITSYPQQCYVFLVSQCNNINILIDYIEDLQVKCNDACIVDDNDNDDNDITNTNTNTNKNKNNNMDVKFNKIFIQLDDFQQFVTKFLMWFVFQNLKPILNKFFNVEHFLSYEPSKSQELLNNNAMFNFLFQFGHELSIILPHKTSSAVFLALLQDRFSRIYFEMFLDKIEREKHFRFKVHKDLIRLMTKDAEAIKDFFEEYSDLIPLHVTEKFYANHMDVVTCISVVLALPVEFIVVPDEFNKSNIITEPANAFLSLMKFRNEIKNKHLNTLMMKTWNKDISHVQHDNHDSKTADPNDVHFLSSGSIINNDISHMEKRIELILVSGTDLSICDATSSDPYCRIKYMNKKEHSIYDKKTEIIYKCLNPIWNCLIQLPNHIALSDISKITFNVWDHDRTFDDFMGQCAINMHDIRESCMRQKGTKKVEDVIGLRLKLDTLKSSSLLFDKENVLGACELKVSLKEKPNHHDNVQGYITIYAILYK